MRLSRRSPFPAAHGGGACQREPRESAGSGLGGDGSTIPGPRQGWRRDGTLRWYRFVVSGETVPQRTNRTGLHFSWVTPFLLQRGPQSSNLQMVQIPDHRAAIPIACDPVEYSCPFGEPDRCNACHHGGLASFSELLFFRQRISANMRKVIPLPGCRSFCPDHLFRKADRPNQRPGNLLPPSRLWRGNQGLTPLTLPMTMRATVGNSYRS
jgi:hypothetical protein